MADEKVEALKNVGDHIAGLGAVTSIGAWLVQVAQTVSIVAGMLAISWYLYRWYEKFHLHPKRERELRTWYESELSGLMNKQPEFFRETPLEVLRSYHSIYHKNSTKGEE